MAVKADTVVVELRAEIDRYKRDMDRAERGFKDNMNDMQRRAGLFESKTKASFAGVSQSANSMSGALKGAVSAIALAAGATAGIRILASYEQAMSTVAAITQATGDKLAALEAKARDLGSTTRFSATQAAEGMLFLARAGFTTDEVLASIEGTLQLAQAGNLDLGRAADIASNALSGFNLKADESARLVDVLAAAANAANTDVNQLGEALKFAAPTAVALGLDVEETVAIIGKLSDAGIQAGLAGRGFQSLGTQFENNRDKIEKLIGSYDLAEEGLAAIIRRLDKAGITTKQIIEIFRAENLDVFTVLRNASLDSAKGLDVLQTKLENSAGTAKRVATVMDDNLNGALLATKSRLEEVILALGDAGATDALIEALEGLQALLVLTAENADIMSVAIIALTIRALLPMAVAVGQSVIRAVTALAAELVVLNAIAGRSVTAFTAVAGTAGRMAAALGPYTIAIALAATAWVAFARDTKSASEALDDVGGALVKLDGIQSQLESDTKLLEDANRKLTQAIEEQGEAAADTARLEIDALQQRIEKNRELAEVYEAQAQVALIDAREGVGVLGGGQARGLLGDKAFTETATSGRVSRGGLGTPTDQSELRLKSQSELSKLVEEEYRIATQRLDAGDRLTDQQREIIKYVAERREQFQKLSDAEERLAAIRSVSEAGADRAFVEAEPSVKGAPSAGADAETKKAREAREKAVDEAKAALAELEDAFKSTYQIERDEVAKTHAEQLKAIKTLGLKGDERRQAELKAELAAQAEIGRINAEEAADRLKIEQDLEDRKADATRREIDLLDQVLDARDRLAGRYFAIMEREFARKEDYIRQEIDNEERKNKALIAMAEERTLAEKDIRDRIAGRGEYSSDDNAATISTAQRDEGERTANVDDQLSTKLGDLEARYEEERILMEEDFEAKLALEQGYHEERAALEEEAADLRNAIMLASMAVQAKAVEDGLGRATSAMQKAFGEQSGIYKSFFLLQKGAAVVASTIAMYQNIAEASKAGYPQNIALMAAAAAQGAAIISSVQSVQATFGGGRERGGPVRPDEFYEVNEKGKPELLQKNGKYYLMSGGYGQVEPAISAPNFSTEDQLARINQPLSVNPSFFGGGGRSIDVGGVSLNVQGNVSDDTLPALREMMGELRREVARDTERALYRDRLWSKPRHEKTSFFKG